jgi:tetratricopeptide (TPR) repeat protein|nr:MAG TPA: helicase [Caudoviricetes sp.]
MGLKDVFNIGKTAKENAGLKELMSPEFQNASVLNSKVAELEAKKERLEKEIDKRTSKIDTLKKEAIFFEDAITFQEFGLYTPRYNFVTSEEYKEELDNIRDAQKKLIKSDKAIIGATTWTVNGSKSKGNKMIADMKKLFLRAFNSDCEDVISKVKYNNFDMSLKKIHQSANSIERLGKSMSLKITPKYIDWKEEELTLAFEYQQKKQEEKEAQKAARAEMREAARLQKEIEAQRKKIEKEQTHYQTAYEKLLKQLEENPDNADLLTKKSELENQLNDIDKAIKDIDYREANQRAGYVYIISNIGAFGENVYKIGMTRRLDPQDRVDELGDASVPFNFDVHAMIFSDDAPALEAALHKAFEDRKLNMVNTRREFFNVTLDEIKEVVKKNFDKTVEFIDVPDAEQFRVSQKMKRKQ